MSASRSSTRNLAQVGRQAGVGRAVRLWEGGVGLGEGRCASGARSVRVRCVLTNSTAQPTRRSASRHSWPSLDVPEDVEPDEQQSWQVAGGPPHRKHRQQAGRGQPVSHHVQHCSAGGFASFPLHRSNDCVGGCSARQAHIDAFGSASIRGAAAAATLPSSHPSPGWSTG